MVTMYVNRIAVGRQDTMIEWATNEVKPSADSHRQTNASADMADADKKLNTE